MRRLRKATFTMPAERSNAAEGVSTFKTNLMAEMAAFDRLPKRIQRWLDGGPRKYSAVQIEDLWLDGERIDTPGFYDEEGPSSSPASFKRVSFLDMLRGRG